MGSPANNVPLFALGRLLMTPGAREAMAEAGQSPREFIRRHVTGDWGEMSADDRKLNDEALFTCERIFSSYKTARGVRLWVITERDRSATTLLLPDEY
jgi:hypothetical protein